MKVTTALFFFFAAASASANEIPVRISLIEALAPRDTTSSERFQKDFEVAISTSKSKLSNKLKSCGYALETDVRFYDAGDPVQALERARQAVEAGTWMIVGPRRSNHYLLLAQGAGDVPTVSMMASADAVRDLGPRHLSLSPLNFEMASVAAQEAKRRLPSRVNATYFSIVASDCISCKDFADGFDKAAVAFGMKSLGRIAVSGEQPDLAPILAKVKSGSPAFILLPNYSKLSSHLMAGIQPHLKHGFFVGSDGWGDSKFGFVQNGKDLTGASGFTVRGSPPIEKGLKQFALGRALTQEHRPDTQPLSGASLAILASLDGVADILCKERPANSKSFGEAFQRFAPKRFVAPWGVSIYDLAHGEITYRRSIRKNK